MTEVNHRIRYGFEGVVQVTQVIESEQQAAKLILPGEHTLDCLKSLCKNVGIKQRLAATFRLLPAAAWIGITIRFHVTIKEHVSVTGFSNKW
jgi:hypothetical protein